MLCYFVVLFNVTLCKFCFRPCCSAIYVMTGYVATLNCYVTCYIMICYITLHQVSTNQNPQIILPMAATAGIVLEKVALH